MGRRCWREAVPEAARRLTGEAMHVDMKNDPRQFAGAKPCIEPFEPLEFGHDGVGHAQLALGRVNVQGIGHEPEHPLLRKATLEAAHGFWMVPVSWARCVAVRSGQSSNGRMSSYRYCVGSRNGAVGSLRHRERATLVKPLQAPRGHAVPGPGCARDTPGRTCARDTSLRRRGSGCRP